MALVREWLPDFLDRHRARHKPHDWPPEDSDAYAVFMKGWISHLSLKEATEAEADAASERLMLSPPRWQQEHLPAVIRVIEEFRTQATAGTDRDSAALASRGCCQCHGVGLTVVWDRQPRPGSPETVSAHCTCPLGRWMRQNTAAAEVQRIPDAADAGRAGSRWRLDPLDMDEWSDRVNLEHFSPADLIREWTSAAAPSRRPRPRPALAVVDPVEPTQRQLDRAAESRAEINRQFSQRRDNPEAA